MAMESRTESCDGEPESMEDEGARTEDDEEWGRNKEDWMVTGVEEFGSK